jgi:hypothetical protein
MFAVIVDDDTEPMPQNHDRWIKRRYWAEADKLISINGVPSTIQLPSTRLPAVIVSKN